MALADAFCASEVAPTVVSMPMSVSSASTFLAMAPARIISQPMPSPTTRITFLLLPLLGHFSRRSSSMTPCLKSNCSAVCGTGAAHVSGSGVGVTEKPRDAMAHSIMAQSIELLRAVGARRRHSRLLLLFTLPQGEDN
eukprot:scaffold9899_cov122-Isochrysis_galbana.AAC.9